MNTKLSERGFVLLDVVFALFLFSLGFAALYGLTEGATQEAQQVINLTEAANFAQDLIEDLAAQPWTDNLLKGRCKPGETVEGQKGRFQWKLFSEWDTPGELLRVQVEVSWKEKGKTQKYSLETLFAIQ
jgi:Tfp pilus assembly protein PilV